MLSKKIDYIIIYSFLLASILCIAMLVRLFVVRQLQMDEFSGLVAFIITCILFGAIYFSFQSIVNECLLPLVERIFGKGQQSIHELNVETVLTKPMETIIPKEEASIPQYNDYKQAAQQKIQEEQMQILENVLCYTGQELSLYVEEDEMQKLYKYIRLFQFASEKECNKIKPAVIVDPKLKPIDMMYFGWNIGNQFKKTGIETATFIKRVFAEVLKENEISTLKSKLRSSDGTCIIKIKKEL
ncbi:hypothetical protein [Bacteroides sp. UBA939]|uniref:hypothetical protein n=1 Tax=Bacteroides sp. UBA939 TaxID=1946092 RepID=UPI0025C397A1|nr:hypothetical protein [Bacteroides sp. UBA939]